MIPAPLLTLLLACTPAPSGEPGPPLEFEPAGPVHAPDTSTWGPFPVGVTRLFVEVPGYEDVDGEPRVLPVEVWYPAASAEGEVQVYALADEMPAERLELEGITADQLPEFPSASLVEGAPDTHHGPYPLVLFSHGNGGMRLQSVFFTEVLASHGYVVASPDHVGNTLGDFLVPGFDDDASTIRALGERPADIQAVLERLLADPPAPVDPERVGISGHSLGAWTAINSGAADPRFSVIVAQAPPDTSFAMAGTGRLPEQLNKPLMLQAGDRDQILEYESNAVLGFSRLYPPSWLVTYVNAGHFTFSDLCTLDLGPLQDVIQDSVGNVLSDGCGELNLDPAIGLPLIRQHGIGLFNVVLRESPGSSVYLEADGEDAILEGGF